MLTPMSASMSAHAGVVLAQVQLGEQPADAAVDHIGPVEEVVAGKAVVSLRRVPCGQR